MKEQGSSSAWSRRASLGSAAENVAGQALWAASQLAVLILLSHQEMPRLVGIYAVGLGIFTVVTLFLGLNLRIAVSTDRKFVFGFRSAVTARLIACMVALPVAIGGMTLMQPTGPELLVASLLVGARTGDQLSDVVVGFYLRREAQRSASRSFLVRGFASLVVVFAGWFGGWGLSKFALAMFAAVILSSFIADVLPESRAHAHTVPDTLLALAKRTWAVSPYPALDALHTNSLRFVLAILTGPSFYGLVAIAQVIFVPFQIVTSAVGVVYLQDVQRSHQRDETALRQQVITGLLYGLAIGLAFAAACVFFPDVLGRLLFAGAWQDAQLPLLVTALSLGLAPASGILSLAVVSGQLRTSYVSAPLFGLVIVWLAAGAIMVAQVLGQSPSLTTIALAVATVFVVSFTIRIIVNLKALSAAVQARGALDRNQSSDTLR